MFTIFFAYVRIILASSNDKPETAEQEEIDIVCDQKNSVGTENSNSLVVLGKIIATKVIDKFGGLKFDDIHEDWLNYGFFNDHYDVIDENMQEYDFVDNQGPIRCLAEQINRIILTIDFAKVVKESYSTCTVVQTENGIECSVESANERTNDSEDIIKQVKAIVEDLVEEHLTQVVSNDLMRSMFDAMVNKISFKYFVEEEIDCVMNFIKGNIESCFTDETKKNIKTYYQNKKQEGNLKIKTRTMEPNENSDMSSGMKVKHNLSDECTVCESNEDKKE